MNRAAAAMALGLGGLLSAAPASAMDVCRRAKVESNSFDGKSVVKIPAFGGHVIVDEEGAKLTLRISGGGVQAVGLRQGWPFTYALEDGTKVSFYAMQDVTPTGTAYATQYTAGVYTTWTITAMVSEEAAHAIASSAPVAIRYSIDKDERTHDYKLGPQRALQAAFACVAHKLQDR